MDAKSAGRQARTAASKREHVTPADRAYIGHARQLGDQAPDAISEFDDACSCVSHEKAAVGSHRQFEYRRGELVRRNGVDPEGGHHRKHGCRDGDLLPAHKARPRVHDDPPIIDD